jgi:hypothetical protein
MIKVEKRTALRYIVNVDKADYQAMRRIAVGYGLSLSTVIASCITKGIREYETTLSEIRDVERAQRNARGRR